MALDSLNCRNGHTALVPQELSCASSPECSLCVHFPFFFFFCGAVEGMGGSRFVKRETTGHLHVKQVVA